MANRRMFTMDIVDSDAFTEMPLSSQALYFHLGMRADDDGFVNNPKKIQRMIGAAEDDLKLLIAKRFILAFSSGIIVIKHWLMQNQIRKDRYKPTLYQEERSSLYLKDNGSYTDTLPDGNQLATNWQPDGNQLAPQYSIGKYSVGKYSNTYLLTGENQFSTSDNSVENYVDNSVLSGDEHQIRPMGGTLGQGLLDLSDAQQEDLLSFLSVEEFDHYCSVIVEGVKKGWKYGKTHYQAILEMATADRKLR